jgi:hypothetical protein
LIHPGRVKLGVNLREDLGPVLEAGRTYRLVIGRDVQDADGRPMAKAFTKSFRTTPAIRDRVDLAAARVVVPSAGTREPLRLIFPRALDRFLLERDVSLLDASGRPVSGRVEISDEERGWQFHPTAAWTAGQYRLRVAAALEDVAGNTPEKPFEVDLTAAALPALAREREIVVE